MSKHRNRYGTFCRSRACRDEQHDECLLDTGQMRCHCDCHPLCEWPSCRELRAELAVNHITNVCFVSADGTATNGEWVMACTCGTRRVALTRKSLADREAFDHLRVIGLSPVWEETHR